MPAFDDAGHKVKLPLNPTAHVLKGKKAGIYYKISWSTNHTIHTGEMFSPHG